MADARAVSSHLDVHLEVDQVDEDLYVALGLHVASHYSEREPRLAVFRDKRGDDRVKRAFVGFETIEVGIVQGEQRSAVLQDETRLAGDHLRAEAVIVALDERAAVAVFVDDGQIDRVSCFSLGSPAGTSVAAFVMSILALCVSPYGLEISSAVGRRLKSGSA